MAIRLTCRCGKRLFIDNKYSGKQFKCPACSEKLKVPGRKQPTVRKRQKKTDDDVVDLELLEEDDVVDFELLEEIEQKGESAASVNLTCHKCNCKFQHIIEESQQPAKCPLCAAQVVIPGAVGQASSQADSSRSEPSFDPAFLGHQSVWEDNRPKVRAKEAGWNPTRRGLNLVYMAGVGVSIGTLGSLSVILAAAAVGLMIYITAMLVSGNPEHAASVMVIAVVGSILLTIAGGIVRIIMIVAEEFILWAIGFFAITVLMAWLMMASQFSAIGIVLLVNSVVILLASFLGLVGWCTCIAIPRESGVKILAFGAALCLLFTIGSYFGALYTAIDVSSASSAANLLTAGRFIGMCALTYAFGGVGHLLFTLMLRGIPRFFEDQNILESTTHYFIYHVCVTVAGFVVVLLIALQHMGIVAVGFFNFVFLMLAVVNIFWFLRLVGWNRDLIWQRMSRKQRRGA